MRVYAGWKYLGAVYVECNKAFGKTPLCMVESCNGETVVDLPYIQIIITPRHLMRHNKGKSHDDRKQKSAEKHEHNKTKYRN